MTGHQSKRAAAQAKLEQAKEILLQHPQKDIDWQREQQIKAHTKLNDDDDDTQVYKDHGDALTIAYQSGYYDGKKAALAGRERNFCERCGKRTNDIHTCTPPQRTWVYLTDEHIKEIVGPWGDTPIKGYTRKLVGRIEAKSKELNA